MLDFARTVVHLIDNGNRNVHRRGAPCSNCSSLDDHIPSRPADISALLFTIVKNPGSQTHSSDSAMGYVSRIQGGQNSPNRQTSFPVRPVGTSLAKRSLIQQPRKLERYLWHQVDFLQGLLLRPLHILQ
jgi:hypothetical protein